MSEQDVSDALGAELRGLWYRYVDLTAPLRPVLHAYCRRLTRNLWDAEDLVQDTLLRAFGHLGMVNHSVANPRAYLLRTATNVWLDELRRREREQSAPPEAFYSVAAPAKTVATETELKDAGARLLQRLSPQERAAVVLKEMFEMTLEEIADVLGTTTGAVKSALHRGRERLREPEEARGSRRPVPTPELLDRWLACWRAKDLPGLAALLLDGATVENVGNSMQFGRDTALRTERNILWHVVHDHAEWPARFRSDERRIERGELDGEPILLAFVRMGSREGLQVVIRIEERDGRIARMRIYGFCPETMREVGERLGVPVLTGLYRPPAPLS